MHFHLFEHSTVLLPHTSKETRTPNADAPCRCTADPEHSSVQGSVDTTEVARNQQKDPAQNNDSVPTIKPRPNRHSPSHRPARVHDHAIHEDEIKPI
jgi:hypothetical protein